MAYPRGNRSLARVNYMKLSLDEVEERLMKAYAEYLGEQPAVLARVVLMDHIRNAVHELQCADSSMREQRTA